MIDNLAIGTNAETAARCKEDVPQIVADAITKLFDTTFGATVGTEG